MTTTTNTDAPAYIVDGVLTDGEAWVALQTHVVSGTSTATITFTSSTGANDWSQYMDLVLIGYAAGEAVGGTNASFINFNNDTTSSYPNQFLYGDGSSVTASTATYDKLYIDAAPGTASPQPWGVSVTNIYDINSGKYKTATSQLAADRNGAGMVGVYAATWLKQSAITEIDIACGFDFLPDTRFDLFGVLPKMVTA